jgi:hypothetical protein
MAFGCQVKARQTGLSKFPETKKMINIHHMQGNFGSTVLSDY